MTAPDALRSIQNSIEATQHRLKSANGYTQRQSVLACRAELVAAVAELNRAIQGCTRVLEAEAIDDRQLNLFRQAGAI